MANTENSNIGKTKDDDEEIKKRVIQELREYMEEQVCMLCGKPEDEECNDDRCKQAEIRHNKMLYG